MTLKLHNTLALHSIEVQVIQSVNNYCPMSYFMNILTELVKILEGSTYKSMGKNINAIFNIELTLKVYKILGA